MIYGIQILIRECTHASLQIHREKQPFRQESRLRRDYYWRLLWKAEFFWEKRPSRRYVCEKKKIIGGLIVDNDHVSRQRAQSRRWSLLALKEFLVWAAVNLVRCTYFFVYIPGRAPHQAACADYMIIYKGGGGVRRLIPFSKNAPASIYGCGRRSRGKLNYEFLVRALS